MLPLTLWTQNMESVTVSHRWMARTATVLPAATLIVCRPPRHNLVPRERIERPSSVCRTEALPLDERGM